MSEEKSPIISSSQTGPHKNLPALVEKYQCSKIKDSIPNHAYDAFAKAKRFVANDSIILDSGCGVGESSYHIAKKYPDIKVIAIDKSVARLNRSHIHGEQPKNLLLLHADCVHFWRLAQQQQLSVLRHYLLYPNPWPKPGHLQRRWHGHPVFPVLIALGGELMMRTNWLIYAQEFAQALALTKNKNFSVNRFIPKNPITPFERKYLASQHELYQVLAELI